jgi:hypothetical protein
MSLGLYILIDGTPVECGDVLTWASWFEEYGEERQLARDVIGETTVSTIFLGVDFNHTRTGPPILWETMVFGGPHNMWGQRYRSAPAAIKGHAEAVAMVQEKDAPQGLS